MSSRKLLTTIAASALAVGAPAGCASTSDPAPSSASRQQQSPLAELVADVPGSLRKAADSTDQITSMSFTMTGTSAGAKISGKGSMAFRPLKMDMTVDSSADGPTAILLLNSTFYMKIPADQRAEMNGKTWMKISPGKDSPFTATSGPWRDVNPVGQVKTLLASGTAKAIGQETVNSVPTVHYSATTPVATALAQIDSAYRDTAKKAYEQAGVKEITTDMWIDAQYRPHRTRVVAGAKNDLTAEYTGYNQPVTVTAPPASQTFDINDAIKNLGK